MVVVFGFWVFGMVMFGFDLLMVFVLFWVVVGLVCFGVLVGLLTWLFDCVCVYGFVWLLMFWFDCFNGVWVVGCGVCYVWMFVLWFVCVLLVCLDFLFVVVGYYILLAWVFLLLIVLGFVLWSCLGLFCGFLWLVSICIFASTITICYVLFVDCVGLGWGLGC